MTKKQEIANLIFPNIKDTVATLEERFPIRNLSEGAIVTRFAPSPTGFLHTGSLFTSLVSWRFAKQTEGVFFCRLEDTDQKREIKGSGDKVLEQLHVFGITPDESYINEGNYGPYVQSERREIYHTVIKEMVEKGLAYPCFCTHDELNEIRKYQEENKLLPGYYKEFAKCRKLTDDEVIAKIKNGEDFVIRFKSNGDEDNRVDLYDAIRGHIQFPENIQDVVIMKSDGLPTYHFAHVVDDHFMRTTHVTRGEEWMSSVPIHLQLFEALGWEKPIYCHFPVIMKLDNGNRRKLSKRKDLEASVDYFLEQGYPIDGFLEYLMTLANSNFEEWRLANPYEDIFKFNLQFEKMSLDGALFDIEKIKSICKETLGNMRASTIAINALEWAKQYDQEFADAILSDTDMFVDLMNIERGGEKPRKDYEKYSDIFPIIDFMYDQYYNKTLQEKLPFNERFTSDQLKTSLEAFLADTGLELAEENWFMKLKETAAKLGFAPRAKDYKKNPDQYIGHIGDFAEIIRIAVAGRKSTPNFYHILEIMGEEKVKTRINKVISLL